VNLKEVEGEGVE